MELTAHHQAHDVAILGGGVAGLAVAWRAARSGMRVVLLERDPEVGSGATASAAGMLAPTTEADAREPALLRIGLDAARSWPAFSEELAAASGRDPGYRRCGTLVVARDGDEAEALEREHELRERLGLEVERLRPTAARRLEPGLAPVLRLALEAPGDHAVDPRALARALAAAAQAAGAELRTGVALERLVLKDGAVAGVEAAGGERVLAPRVVVAMGAWSGDVPGLPARARVPVRPVKGQWARLRDPAGPGLLRRIVRMADAYLVPRGDGRYVLGATMEERGFDTTVTAGALFALLREAAELVPGTGELVVEEIGAGLRPGTPDNLPVVGPGAVEGLHWATGHHRNGILLAPLTGDLVAAALAGEQPRELAVLSPARFAGAASRPAEGAPA